MGRLHPIIYSAGYETKTCIFNTNRALGTHWLFSGVDVTPLNFTESTSDGAWKIQGTARWTVPGVDLWHYSMVTYD